jgi:hypothetical protein
VNVVEGVSGATECDLSNKNTKYKMVTKFTKSAKNVSCFLTYNIHFKLL